MTDDDVGPLYESGRLDFAGLSPAARAALARTVGDPPPPDAPADMLPDGMPNPDALVAPVEIGGMACELARRALEGRAPTIDISAAFPGANATGALGLVRGVVLRGSLEVAAAAHFTHAYLKASGLTASEARELADLERPERVGGLFDYDRLTVDERLEVERLRRTLVAALRLLSGGALRDVSPTAPEAGVRMGDVVVDLEDGGPPVTLTAADNAAASVVIARHLGPDAPDGTRTLVFPGNLTTGPHTELPTAAHAAARLTELLEKGQIPRDEWAALLERQRTRADGTRAPLLGEFLEAHSQIHGRDWAPLHTAIVHELDIRIRLEAEERRAAEAEAERDALAQQLEEERARKRRPPALRQGIGFLRAIAQRATHVDEALKRGQLGKLGARLTTAEAEARKLFKYEPLGWKERLVVHALAAIAREQGKLEAHPWALRRKPLAADDAPRVRIAFPGVAELARVAGYQPDASGRIPKEVRRVLENALRDLTTRPRWVAEPVLVPVQKGRRTELVEDVRVVQTLWVELAATALTRHAELRLHPVAFASHLASYVPVGDLAARYEAARRAVGGRRMLDEWATADDYLRYRASVKLGDARAGAVRAAKGDGATPDEAAAHGAAAVAAVGDSIRADVSDATLRDALGIAHLTRDRGAAPARKRVADALAFAQAMGTLRTFTLEDGTKGPTWRLELAPPAVHGAGEDAAQGQLFAPAAPAGGTP
jgi:hypothetical protein